MSSKKEIKVGMYNTEPDESRQKQIAQVLDDTPLPDRQGIEEIVTKLNVAIVEGRHTLKPAEAASLKLLSQKFIPDAPKELNIKAEVKTEQVIMSWLARNGELETLAETQALAMQPIQDAAYEMLEGFAVEIRGEEKE